MQRTLKILVIMTVICMIAVAPTWAQAISLSGAINQTESTNQSGIFSTLNAALRCGGPIGGWSSTSGTMAVFFNGPTYDAGVSLPGVDNVCHVWLTPDHGKTQWEAKQVAKEGYQLCLPYLTPGRIHTLEWIVQSKDKHNRLTIVFIPFNWSSKRTNSMANHVMVQMAPQGWEMMNELQVYACLRGFVPAWATPDPAILAQQQFTQPQQQTQPTNTVQQDPPPAQLQQPTLTTRTVETPALDGTVSAPIQTNQPTVNVNNSVNTNVNVNANAVATVNPGNQGSPPRDKRVTICFWLGTDKRVLTNQMVNCQWYNSLLMATNAGKDQCLTLKTKAGGFVADAYVRAQDVKCSDGVLSIVELHIYHGDMPKVAVDFWTEEN